MAKCKYRERGSEPCPNEGIMRKQFVKRGDLIGCAFCCQMCLKRNECEFVCDEVAQLDLFDRLWNNRTEG